MTPASDGTCRDDHSKVGHMLSKLSYHDTIGQLQITKGFQVSHQDVARQ